MRCSITSSGSSAEAAPAAGALGAAGAGSRIRGGTKSGEETGGEGGEGGAAGAGGGVGVGGRDCGAGGLGWGFCPLGRSENFTAVGTGGPSRPRGSVGAASGPAACSGG